ncbi:MAG: hypothetical protein HGA19_20615 [Oscillochloris sp.]|nr:hypothetical protein [Oscillochloris sp.]
MEAFLGVSLDPGASVVHSTAWRYECSGGAGRRLILTYLVALAPHFGQALSRHTRQMILQAVGTEQPARSEALMPPAQILLEQVISHALDHLALLMKTDTAIQLALGEVWHSALHYRQQRPAGELREA